MGCDLLPHHVAWLSAHPERTEDWLRSRLADGFHVHHIDGDHANNAHRNLVLIESGDHMMLHNGKSRLLWKPVIARRKNVGRRKKLSINELEAKLAALVEERDRKKKRELRIKMRDIGRAAYASYRDSQ